MSFTLLTVQGALIIPVFFPDVKGALAPTVAAAFVDAVSTLWQVKKPTLTHKPFAIDNRCRAGFLSFGIMTYNKIITSQTFPKSP